MDVYLRIPLELDLGLINIGYLGLVLLRNIYQDTYLQYHGVPWNNKKYYIIHNLQTKKLWKYTICYILSFSIKNTSLKFLYLYVSKYESVLFLKNSIWRYLTCLSNVLRHQPPSYSSFYYCNRSDAEFALLTNCRFLLFQRVATTTDFFCCIHPGPRALNWALKRILLLTAFFHLLLAMPILPQCSVHSSLWQGKILSIQSRR